MAKQYGLIKRDKTVKNVFGSSDSDSDDNAPKAKTASTALNTLKQKQFKEMHEQAMAEDASVFQYDEVYDDIQAKRNEAKLAKKTQEARKPKYIGKLLETAEKRKKEYERRIERQVQKEREEEGEQFKDKESFVTSAYRKKLEEMKEAEEKEKKEAYLESIGDVTKQSDLSGFYRHLYEQKLGKKDEAEEEEEEKEGDVAPPLPAISKDSKIQKNYRKRKLSNDDDQQNDDGQKTEAHLPSHLDADSDFSIESSDDEDKKPEIKKGKVEDKSDVLPQPTAAIKKEKEEEEEEKKKTEEEVAAEESVKKEPVKPKEKIDIWKKRTVGKVFDEALQRYFERKAQREQSG